MFNDNKNVTEVRKRTLDRAVNNSGCNDAAPSTDAVQLVSPVLKLYGGSRYRRLKSIARCLVEAECSPRDLFGVLRNHNELHCVPPLQDVKVQLIAVNAYCDNPTSRVSVRKVRP